MTVEPEVRGYADKAHEDLEILTLKAVVRFLIAEVAINSRLKAERVPGLMDLVAADVVREAGLPDAISEVQEGLEPYKRDYAHFSEMVKTIDEERASR